MVRLGTVKTYGEIGSFEVLEKLEESGFSVVYKGRNLLDQRLVRLRVCQSRDPRLRERFIRAVESTVSLEHQNILPILDSGTLDSKPFVAHDFFSIAHLGEEVRNPDAISRGRKIDLLIQIAEALQHAHSKGVLHGDLKPEVALISERRLVKVFEFGTAKLSDAAILLEHPGIAPTRLGYPTPEQALGLVADQRTDMFCFGALIYELLSGKKPFSGETWGEQLRKVLQEEPPPIADRWPECPPTLSALVFRSLRKEPRDRDSSFGKVINDLISSLGQLASKERLQAVSDALPRPPLAPDDPNQR